MHRQTHGRTHLFLIHPLQSTVSHIVTPLEPMTHASSYSWVDRPRHSDRHNTGRSIALAVSESDMNVCATVNTCRCTRRRRGQQHSGNMWKQAHPHVCTATHTHNVRTYVRTYVHAHICTYVCSKQTHIRLHVHTHKHTPQYYFAE